MRNGAHPADALRNLGSFARVASFHDGFKAAIHAAAEVGVDNLAVFHLYFGFKMAFDSGDRINGDAHGLGHVCS